MDDLLPAAPTDRSWWLTPSVLGGAYPGNWDALEAATKVQALLDVGVTLFLDLTTEHDRLEPYQQLLPSNVRRINLPVLDLSVAPGEVVRQACQLIDDEAAAGGLVYVHCWGGRGRTGSILGCWLARDIGGRAAQARLDEVRGEAELRRGPAPETAAQRALVRGWTG